jgi:pSer/pThr/pTyr-binding forkhead associated (FHA) protein
MEAQFRLLTSNEDISAPQVVFLNQDSIVIGRGSVDNAVDILISLRKYEREVISRKHALVTRKENSDRKTFKYYLADLDSVNGVFVNNQRIRKQLLCDGDIVQFGGSGSVDFGQYLTKSEASIRYEFKSLVKRSSPSNFSDSGGKRPRSCSSGSVGGVEDDSWPLKDYKTPVAVGSKSAHYDDLKRSKDEILQMGKHLTQLKLQLSKKEDELVKLEEKLTPQTNSFKEEQAKLEAQNTKLNKMSQTDQNTIKTLKDEFCKVVQEFSDLKSSYKSLLEENKQAQFQLQVQQAELDKLRTIKEPSIMSPKARNGILKTSPEGNSFNNTTTRHEKNKNTSSSNINHSLQQQNVGSSLIDYSSLRALLLCPLCSMVMIDPVILKCSHGFCRSCLEHHWFDHKYVSKCPLCYNLKKISKQTNRMKQQVIHDHAIKHEIYYRSENLENFLWLYLEASSKSDSEVSI